MRIYIVRHGEAEPATLQSLDADRRLTSKGQEQAHHVGAALRSLGEIPELILTSPLPRAYETAKLAANAISANRGYPPIRIFDRLATGVHPGDVLAAIPKEPLSVMLVGHQPTLGALVGVLIGGPHARAIDLSTASLACVETPITPAPGVARLEYFVRAKVISALSKKE